MLKPLRMDIEHGTRVFHEHPLGPFVRYHEIAPFFTIAVWANRVRKLDELVTSLSVSAAGVPLGKEEKFYWKLKDALEEAGERLNEANDALDIALARAGCEEALDRLGLDFEELPYA